MISTRTRVDFSCEVGVEARSNKKWNEWNLEQIILNFHELNANVRAALSKWNRLLRSSVVFVYIIQC